MENEILNNNPEDSNISENEKDKKPWENDNIKYDYIIFKLGEENDDISENTGV